MLLLTIISRPVYNNLKNDECGIIVLAGRACSSTSIIMLRVCLTSAYVRSSSDTSPTPAANSPRVASCCRCCITNIIFFVVFPLKSPKRSAFSALDVCLVCGTGMHASQNDPSLPRSRLVRVPKCCFSSQDSFWNRRSVYALTTAVVVLHGSRSFTTH